MHESVATLLSGLIDYAGLFPPAGLPMPAAVHNYAHYLTAPYPWILGRFILPANRLEEFERAAEPRLWPRSRSAWRLSALAGDPVRDFQEIEEFNRKHTDLPAVPATIDTVEIKVTGVQDLIAILAKAPSSVSLYCEVPVEGEFAQHLEVLSRHGARAKIRCGGLSPESFPAAERLALFLKACTAADVGFKATAGLHHPVRGTFPVHYEAGSPRVLMHGFLNLALAAAWARQGMQAEELVELLEEKSGAAFRFSDEGAIWRGHFLSRPEIAEARDGFFHAFGSCSFSEPVGDLRKMNLI